MRSRDSGGATPAALPRRFRISHVITKGQPMGGSQIDTLYAVQYQHASHDVDVVMGNNGPLADACSDVGVPFTVIPMRNRLVDPIGDLRAFANLVRHFRRFKPSIVHTHTSKAGILGRLAARTAGVPVV